VILASDLHATCELDKCLIVLASCFPPGGNAEISRWVNCIAAGSRGWLNVLCAPFSNVSPLGNLTLTVQGLQPPGQVPPKTYSILYVYCHYSQLNFTRCYAFMSQILKSQMFITKFFRPLTTFKNHHYSFDTFGWRLSYRCHYIFINILKSVHTLIIYEPFQFFTIWFSHEHMGSYSCQA